MQSAKILLSLGVGIGLLSLVGGCGNEGGEGIAIDNNGRLVSSTLSDRAQRAPCTAGEDRCTPTNITGDICYAFLGLGDFNGGGLLSDGVAGSG